MFSDEYWMREALLLAERAASLGEVPVGAVVVLNNVIIGSGWNQSISVIDPTAHAEIVAIRNAAKTLNNYRLTSAQLFVTLEPCSMCAGAIVHSRIARLVYGASEPKSGVISSQQEFFNQEFLNHKPEIVGGILADESGQLLQQFFQQRRDIAKSLKK